MRIGEWTHGLSPTTPHRGRREGQAAMTERALETLAIAYRMT
jgi:hypothetical protein